MIENITVRFDFVCIEIYVCNTLFGCLNMLVCMDNVSNEESLCIRTLLS